MKKENANTIVDGAEHRVVEFTPIVGLDGTDRMAKLGFDIGVKLLDGLSYVRLVP